MAYKPMPISDYRKRLRPVRWRLVKGSIDWKLATARGEFICAIKVVHARGRKAEVAAYSVRRTEREFQERGWQWSQSSKSKKSLQSLSVR